MTPPTLRRQLRTATTTTPEETLAQLVNICDDYTEKHQGEGDIFKHHQTRTPCIASVSGDHSRGIQKPRSVSFSRDQHRDRSSSADRHRSSRRSNDRNTPNRRYDSRSPSRGSRQRSREGFEDRSRFGPYWSREAVGPKLFGEVSSPQEAVSDKFLARRIKASIK